MITCACACHNGPHIDCTIPGGCGYLHTEHDGRCTVPSCGRPSPDARICRICTDRVLADLDAEARHGVGAVWADLEITRTSQDHVGVDLGRRAADEMRLPWKEHASRAAQELQAALTLWVMSLTYHTGLSGPAHTSAPAQSNYLRQHIHALRHLPYAADRIAAFRKAMGRARHVIDLPVDGRIFLGPCVHIIDHNQSCEPDCEEHTEQCGADLYGQPDHDTARCTKCGSEYDVPETQEWMRDQVRHEVAPAPLLAGLLTRLGVPCTAADIHGLARARAIDAVAMDSAKRRTYRAGDILDALAARDAEAVVRRALADVYTADGVEVWLHAENRALDGHRPMDLLRAGQADPVLQLIERLAGGQQQAS